MDTPEGVPIPIQPEARPIKRHRSVKDYAHRVQQRVRDSFKTRVSKLVCAAFLSILFFLGLIAFILWLSLRPHRPRFYIQDFSIPSLGQSAGFENAQIMFNATARNSNQHIAIQYLSMEGSVYYKDQKIGTTPLPSPFEQEPKNTTILNAVLAGATLTVTSSSWMLFNSDRMQGVVMFRLEIFSMIKFKISTWTSHRHGLHANCNVEVGPDGRILPRVRGTRCPVYFT